ncbi:MAG: hypothetical protein ACR2PR_08090 [Pseudohongiellaceae bacterium]
MANKILTPHETRQLTQHALNIMRSGILESLRYPTELVPLPWYRRFYYWILRKPRPRRAVMPPWPRTCSDTITIRRPPRFIISGK